MKIPNTGYEGTQFSYTAGSVISIHSLESIWDYLVKVKLCLFYDHVTSLLEIHPSGTHTHIYANMLSRSVVSNSWTRVSCNAGGVRTAWATRGPNTHVY